MKERIPKTVQRSAFCRSRRELSNASLLANFRFDTAENEPSKVCRLPLTEMPVVAVPCLGIVSLPAKVPQRLPRKGPRPPKARPLKPPSKPPSPPEATAEASVPTGCVRVNSSVGDGLSGFRLLLTYGCSLYIKTKFCKKICVWQHFSSSTRFASFCTAAISKNSQKIGLNKQQFS